MTTIGRKGITRTGAAEFNQIAAEELTDYQKDTIRELPQSAVDRLRPVAQDVLTRHCTHHQHDLPEEQQFHLTSARIKFLSHLDQQGLSGAWIVDQVAESLGAQAARTQAVYSQPLQVQVPPNPVAAAYQQTPGSLVPPQPPAAVGQDAALLNQGSRTSAGYQIVDGPTFADQSAA